MEKGFGESVMRQNVTRPIFSIVIALASLSAVPPSASGFAAHANPVEIPPTFEVAWMRGLVVEDHADGAVVVTANEKVKVGTIFTKIDGKTVTGASDLLLKIKAGDIKKLSITTVTSEIVKNAPPFYYDMWAEGLVLADTPQGVLIVNSAYPDEAGKLLVAINRQPLRTVADAHALLLEIVNGRVPYSSRTTGELNAEEAAAAKVIIAAKTAPAKAPFADTWGALAILPGKSWFCNGENPGQWLRRQHDARGAARSFTVARMTTARWIEPGRVLDVMTQQGNDRWTDRITLRSDGTFSLTTSGLTGTVPLVGRKEAYGAIVFPLGTTRDALGTNYHSLRFEGAGVNPAMRLAVGYGKPEPSSSTGCDMEEYTDLRAPRLARNLEYSQKQSAEAIEGARRTQEQLDALNAQGAAMLANMQASAIAEFAKIPGVIADVQAQRNDLDRLRRAAEAETAAKASTNNKPSRAGAIVVSKPETSPASVSVSKPSNGTGKSWDEVATYYACSGQTKRQTPNGDAIDTIYYGIVTASRMDVEGARNLFRQHAGTRAATNTEDVGTSCFPRKTRAEAESDLSQRISRDSRGQWRQVTGIDLTL